MQKKIISVLLLISIALNVGLIYQFFYIAITTLLTKS